MYLKSSPRIGLLISQLTPYSEGKKISLEDEPVEGFLTPPTGAFELDVA